MLDTAVFNMQELLGSSIYPTNSTSTEQFKDSCSNFTQEYASCGQWDSSWKAMDAPSGTTPCKSEYNQDMTGSSYGTAYNQGLWFNGGYNDGQCTNYGAEIAQSASFERFSVEGAGTGEYVPSSSLAAASSTAGYAATVPGLSSVGAVASCFPTLQSDNLISSCQRQLEPNNYGHGDGFIASQTKDVSPTSYATCNNYSTSYPPTFTGMTNHSYSYEPYPHHTEFKEGRVRTGVRRLQNRTAASRCRQKRKNQEETLVKELQELEENNFNLAKEIQRLRRESFNLGIILTRHSCERTPSNGSTSETSETESWRDRTSDSFTSVSSVPSSTYTPQSSPTSQNTFNPSVPKSQNSFTASIPSITAMFTAPSRDSFSSASPSSVTDAHSTCSALSSVSVSQPSSAITNLPMTNSYSICDDVFFGMESL